MIKQKLASAKAAVVRNERRILLVALATTTTVAVLEQVGIRQHNIFLKDRNLLDEFYSPNEE